MLQVSNNVLSGLIPIREEELATSLAALRLQAFYGDYDPYQNILTESALHFLKLF